MKADESRSAEALAAVRSYRGAESAALRTGSLFSRPAAESVSGLLRGGPSARESRRQRPCRALEPADRLAHRTPDRLLGRDRGRRSRSDRGRRRRGAVPPVPRRLGLGGEGRHPPAWSGLALARVRTASLALAQLLVSTVPEGRRTHRPHPDLTVSTSGHDLDSLCRVHRHRDAGSDALDDPDRTPHAIAMSATRGGQGLALGSNPT